MKYTLTIDETREEEVLIFAHKHTQLIEKIEAILKDDMQLLGYDGSEIVPLNAEEIYCFSVQGGKLYAITENKKYILKSRLYHIEEKLGNNFLRLNQSSIANISKIKKFDTSLGGTLKVIFKNGYVDYVSRRNNKNVKERFGI